MLIRKLICCVALTWASASCLAGQIIHVTPTLPQANQYARLDFDIEIKAKWKDPFHAKDVSVDLLLTSPSGKQLRLPAFYIDGKPGQPSHWQARFTPQEAGNYSYNAALSESGKLQKPSRTGNFSALPSKAKGFLKPDSNWAFRFDNGEIFRGIGENLCWEKRDSDDSQYFKVLHQDPRFNYESMLEKLSGEGANFIRTWMIYWNLPVDWRWVSNASRYKASAARFNASGIERMDQLIQLAEQYNIYLMLAMDPHVAFMGDGWKNSLYNKANGGFAATPAEFFTSPQTRDMYKDKLRFMVARWGYSPSIAAWEFFNEIDNVTYADSKARIPDEPVVDWHKDMSRYLTDVDPYDHMITTSISHRDLTGLNDIPEIAFNQKHIYKATGAIPKVIKEYTDKHGKPYVIGEAGYEWDWSKNFNDFADEMIYDFKRGLWYGLFSATPIVPLSWWWEFFDEKKTTAYFRSLNDIDLMMRNAGKGQFSSINSTTSNEKVESYAVKAGNQIFVYINNTDNTQQAAKLALDELQATNQVQSYDPETRSFSKQKVSIKDTKAPLDLNLKAREQLVMIISSGTTTSP